MPENIPKISVIIPSFNSKETIADCILSLNRNAIHIDHEIIIIDSSTDDTYEIIKKKYHYEHISTHKYSDRKYPESARNIGIKKSRGEIIAFIDADCIAEKNWLEEIVISHNTYPSFAIGGALANGNTKTCVGWAAYFCQLSHLMPGGKQRVVEGMGAANMSYKKKAFEMYGLFLEDTYSADTEFHWRLGQCGHKLLFVPSIIVSHRHTDGLLSYFFHEYERGQAFARVRVQYQNFPFLRRFLYCAMFPLIAAKRLAKIVKNNLSNRFYIIDFLKYFPLTTLGVLCWSIGESVGYIKGHERVTI